MAIVEEQRQSVFARRKALDAVAGVAQEKLAEALRQSISQIAKG